MMMNWGVTTEVLDGRIHLVRLLQSDVPLTRGRVLELWESDPDFGCFYADTIRSVGLEAFCWETPPLSRSTLCLPHEFVLIDSPAHRQLRPDESPFQEHFASAPPGTRAVAFPNLGKNGIMIAPVPSPDIACQHFASFLNSAPQSAVAELFSVAARETLKILSESPLWISTAGLGVSWLHIRIDCHPKYYRHLPYRSEN